MIGGYAGVGGLREGNAWGMKGSERLLFRDLRGEVGARGKLSERCYIWQTGSL
jgi:hypothetical protein